MPTTSKSNDQLQPRFNSQSHTGKFMQDLLTSGKVDAWNYKPGETYKKFEYNLSDINEKQFQQNFYNMAKAFKKAFPEKEGNQRNLEDSFNGNCLF